jgi:hypothetical protein
MLLERHTEKGNKSGWITIEGGHVSKRITQSMTDVEQSGSWRRKTYEKSGGLFFCFFLLSLGSRASDSLTSSEDRFGAMMGRISYFGVKLKLKLCR